MQYERIEINQLPKGNIGLCESNIAEGFESGSDAKYMNFLNISRGSCGEVRSMLYLCEDLGFCTKDEREQLQTQLRKITSGIVKLSDTISKKTS